MLFWALLSSGVMARLTTDSGTWIGAMEKLRRFTQAPDRCGAAWSATCRQDRFPHVLRGLDRQHWSWLLLGDIDHRQQDLYCDPNRGNSSLYLLDFSDDSDFWFRRGFRECGCDCPTRLQLDNREQCRLDNGQLWSKWKREWDCRV